jgi:hypothetical protein
MRPTPRLDAAILAAVPERSLRPHSGTPFVLPDNGSRQAAQLAQLVRFLSWLSPLNALCREDQHLLGLVSAHARPVQLAEDDEIETALER